MMVDPELLLGAFVALFMLGISAILLIYWRRPKKYDFWKNKGVPFVNPMSVIPNEKPFNETLTKRHQQLGPIYGYFEAEKPKISIADTALLKTILIKDFSYFMNRKHIVTGDEVHDKMLTIARGEDWKRIRNIVSPIFTTGKLKKMLSIFKDCTLVLVQNLKNAAKEKESVDLKSVFGAFTTDVIAGALFSAKVDSHDDPGNQFVKTARDVFGGRPGKKPTPIHELVYGCSALLSRLLKLFRTDHAASSRTEIFRKIALQIVKERRRTGQVRNDFLQLLMDNVEEILKEEKSVSNKTNEAGIDSNYDEQTTRQQTSKKISMDELVGQCLIFFLAGYETTSSTLSFVTHLLAHHQDVQDKLREEVDEVFSNTKGELTYEALQNMKYLDSVINETLRLYPPAIQLERLVEADYQLEDTGLTLPKGMGITIPIYALHRDHQFFHDPEQFDPDRFATKEKSLRDPYSYMPFGSGPRNCVGMRFALLEIKICLSYIIANFRIKRSPNSKEKLEFLPGASGFLRPKEVLVNMEIRRDSIVIV